MCEIEDLSLGHQDIYFNKYSDRFVSGTMDFYITDSLQDMLDIDIKSEMATDLGSTTDFSDALGVSFSDLPPLLDIEMDNATAWIAGSNASLHNSSNFVHNLDLYGSEANAVMVNPNSVMPSMFSESPVKIVNQNSSNLMLNSVNSDSVNMSPLPSPTEEKSHLTFSPNTINLPKIKEEPLESEEDIVSFGRVDSVREASSFVFVKSENLENIKRDLSNELDCKPLKFSSPPAPTIRIKTAQPEILKLNSKSCSILNTNQRVNGTQYVTAQTLGTKTIISGNIHILGHQQSRTLLTNSSKSPATILIDNATLNNNRQIIKTAMSANAFSDSVGTKFIHGNKISFCGEFPKPAYSYSCLIAMALKNSRTGSLPVSEIYNFMCQHFPYFKTAPNGWKNSVRHNLSLNKCFEKIEKPSTNGGQRKGCLWAMNPSKVGKMDEEVQKWSRKDPQAIRKAMVRPDSLEALERGEMKYCGEGEPEGESEGTANEHPEEDCSEEEELDVDEAFLLTASPAGSPSPLIAHHYDDETSDVEVMDGAYDEIDVEESQPIKLEFALASQFHRTESSAKRPKTNFVYQTISATPSHTNRRKTPLVNRIA